MLSAAVWQIMPMYIYWHFCPHIYIQWVKEETLIHIRVNRQSAALYYLNKVSSSRTPKCRYPCSCRTEEPRSISHKRCRCMDPNSLTMVEPAPSQVCCVFISDQNIGVIMWLRHRRAVVWATRNNFDSTNVSNSIWVYSVLLFRQIQVEWGLPLRGSPQKKEKRKPLIDGATCAQ